jgi:hypothetical protein
LSQSAQFQFIVIGLETNEVTPVAFPNLPTQKSTYLRCNHCETANPKVLLLPLCPTCKRLLGDDQLGHQKGFAGSEWAL